MNETLGSKLESVRGEYKLFSTGNASEQSSRLYDASKDALNTLVDQQRVLSKKYKNSGDKNLLQRAKEILSEQEKNIGNAQKMKAFSNIVQVASSQINTLLKAPKEAISGQFHFSHEENTVFVTLTARVLPMLEVINSELKGENNIEKALKKEIEKIILKAAELRGLVKKDNKVAVERLKQRVKDKANMSEKEAKEYDEVLTRFFTTAIEDTDWLHAHIGNLANAHNPMLNLAGDVVERTHLDSLTNFQKPFKDMLNKLQDLGFDITKMDKITHNGEIINERDAEKVEKYDNELKSAIYNDAIGRYLVDLPNSTPETIKEDLEAFFKMTDSEALDAQRKYNLEWTRVIKNGGEFNVTKSDGTVEKLIVKPRFNSYFEESFAKSLLEHEVTVSFNEAPLTKKDIPSDVIERDKEYKAKIMQIRENSKGILTEADQYEIQEENKKRQEDKNPRDIEGNFIVGVTEAYDELSQRYLVVKNEEEFNSLSSTEQKRVMNIIGLNRLDFINQDFWAKENKDRPYGIPQKFLDKLNKLQTEEEKLKFVQTNSYINFDSEFWDNFKQRDGLVDRLRNLGTTEADNLIDAIRKEQSIVSGTLKNNAIYNKPSEINVVEMTAVELLQVKNSSSILENLYTEAYKILPKQEQEDLDADTTVNESYLKDLADEGVTSINKQDELEFLYKHTTSTAWASISQAKSLVKGLKDGTTKTVRKSMQGYFSDKMSDIELDEALLRYARTKVLPYYKRTEPIGYSGHLTKLNEGVKNNTTGTVLNYITNTPGLAVNANFSFYEDDSKINPVWKKNNEEKKEQFTEEYIKQVRNDNYYTYFGIGTDGKPTQNLKDWEAREAILEFQDQMIEYNNLTGVQSRYMIPQVRKTTEERIHGMSLKNTKQFFREMTTFRPEEAEQGQTIGEEAAKKGSSLLTIPTYYNRKLEDPSELTKNTFYAYVIYGQAASLHKARRQNIGDMLVLQDVLTNSKFDGKEAIATNAFKMFKSQLNANFYGVKETFSYEASVLGRKVDLGKLAKMFYNWVRFSNLAGITVPITSALTAEVQKNMETLIGETSNRIAANEGNKLFAKYGTEASKEVMGLSSNAFINVVGEAIGVYNISERFQNSQYNKATRGLLKTSSNLHALGNYPIIPRAFLSIFADYRYVNGAVINYKQFSNTFTNEKQTEIDRQWKEKPMFIEDVKLAVENGSMDFTNPKFLAKVKENVNLDGQELQEYLNEIKNKISQRALSAIQRIDTQVPEHQKSLAARDARSNFFLMHLNYLLVQIPLKLKKKHYNISEETWQEGNWRTTYNFLGKMILRRKDIKNAWKESMGDDLIRTNLKRTVIELAVGNTLAIAAILLANYVDDDDDPAYLLSLGDMFTTRLAVEMVGSTAGLPKQVSGVIENPLITFQRFKDLGGVFDLLSSDTVERGTYAGDSERFRWMAKNLPFFRDYNRWSDPKQAQDTYNYFSVEKEDLYDNFAVFSNLVDDEEF